MTTSCTTPRSVCQLLELIGDRTAVIARRAWGAGAGQRITIAPNGAGQFYFAETPTLQYQLQREDLMARDWYEVRAFIDGEENEVLKRLAKVDD